MSERDGYQPGVPCWVDTWQADAESAVSFYAELFGWDYEDMMPPGVSGQHFMCRVRGRDVAAVASRPTAAPPVSAWNTYVWVDDAAATAEQAQGAGGNVVTEPFDALDGGRIAIIADPAGAVIGIWQPGAHKGAQLVNEPGAWSMSSLNTRDPDGAPAFYREVFGWNAAEMDIGDGGGFALFRLPGFVGGEPQQPVPRDVVATMAAMTDDQFPAEVPSHWRIDFWVGNADATADDAQRLGGRVLAPPYDIPGAPLRQAVLADREGAPFSVTHLTVGGPAG
jgi:predicted enzyme related to lactoylglutathione lyase